MENREYYTKNMEELEELFETYLENYTQDMPFFERRTINVDEVFWEFVDNHMYENEGV